MYYQWPFRVIFFYVVTVFLILTSCSDNSTSTNTEEVVNPVDVTEAAFPGQTGEIAEFNIGAEKVVLEKFGDHYVFQGDIILNDSLLHAMSTDQKNKTIVGELFGLITWPNNTVPYEFAPGVSEEYKSKAMDAMNMVSTDETNVVFKEREGEVYYVVYKESTNGSASATLGLNPFIKQHEITFDPSAYTTGTFAHELLHILGIVHQHTRSDRNDFVKVNTDNITTCNSSNFSRRLSFKTDVEYDINSIMHYGSFACVDISAVDGIEDASIVTKNGQVFDANRSQLTDKDIQQINELYPSERFEKCGDRITDTEGNEYDTVQIGDQCWMADNLKTEKYSNGKKLVNETDPYELSQLQEGAWAYYENDRDNNRIYGKLYNWYAVEDERNICPYGWHVPTDEEWFELIEYAGGINVVGGKLKATILWESPNEGATDEYGFSVLPAGRFVFPNNGEPPESGNVFRGIREFTSIWSSSEWGGDERFAPRFDFGYFTEISFRGASFKQSGNSIRCILD